MNTSAIDRAGELLDLVRENVSRVIVGKDQTINLLLAALLAKGHILVEDVPGIGKTTLVSSLARSLGLSFGRIQFTPDVMPSEITGYTIYNQQQGTFEFKAGMVMHQIVLADEINRASPKTQSALLEVMQERQISVEGRTIHLPEPFMVLATQNAIEHTGTFPLPEAQLDRFMLKINLGYPTVEEEMEIFRRHAAAYPLETLTTVIGEEDVLWLQNQAANVYISESLTRYIASLADQTRRHPSLRLGASPRASLMLVQASRAWALISGRDFVIPDDILELIESVWAHRLILSSSSNLQNQNVHGILRDLLSSIPVPVTA